ncbi:hypothetical protein Airi02_028420 [Actinoallomurus iriomotensis]|uniref:CU044_5270 family protein n=2 Tax=Actinoallomurus iriomotensis TaxID=478107 RepID=A0A9W6S0F8_9ACTN|nr:hypothetical protein Airi02_028420 [Actinoallomurus iriomotensis]
MKGRDMDELELLRTARPDVPSYPEPAREKARAALTAAADPGSRRRAVPAIRRPWGLAGVAAGLVVAVVAAAVVRQAVTHDGTGAVPRPGSATAGTPVNAAQVLSLAADAVEARAAVRPRPDQWAYVKKMSYSSVDRGGEGSVRIAGGGRAMVTEVWTRFDGAREAYRGDNMVDDDRHRLHVANLDHDADETTPIEDYARLAVLPTDPGELVKKLCPNTPSTADPTGCVFSMADKLLRNVALPPRLQAAFYRVLATLPHVVVRRDVADLADRRVLAVAEAYPRDFQSEQILLDPRTYEYRGERLVWTADPNEAPPGAGRTPPRVLVSPTSAQARQEYTETVQLAAGIVDHAGEHPKS